MTVEQRPRNANAELNERRREQITDAARRVMARNGVERTRIIDVADEANVSAGMIQHYFRSRDDLIAATFQRFLDQSKVAWTAAIEAESDPTSKLRALLRTAVGLHMPAVALYTMWIELNAVGTRNARLNELAAAGWGDWLADFETIIADGVEAGAFAPNGSPRDVAVRLVALMDGLSMHVAQHRFGMTALDMYRHVTAAAALDLSVPVDALTDRSLLP